MGADVLCLHRLGHVIHHMCKTTNHTVSESNKTVSGSAAVTRLELFCLHMIDDGGGRSAGQRQKEQSDFLQSSSEGVITDPSAVRAHFY